MIVFTSHVNPIGKPRMTQRDRWKRRPCVLIYHEFKDKLRADAESAGLTSEVKAKGLSWNAYIPMPKSWSIKKKAEMHYALHQSRPDRDNIDKAILDTLFKEDRCIAYGTIRKYWCHPGEERIELLIHEEGDKS